jgi:hypothetical protein
MEFKIFKQGNGNDIETEMNRYFDKEIFLSMNTVIERVDGIDYLTIIICYKSPQY